MTRDRGLAGERRALARHAASAPQALRVGMLMAGDGGGGMEKHATELASTLASRGHHVTLIGAATLASRLSPAVAHRVMDLAGSRYNPLTLLALYRCLAATPMDVLHAHGNKATAMLGALRRYLPRTCLIGTIHNVKRKTSMFDAMDACIAVSSAAAASVRNPHRHIVLNGVDTPRLRHLGPSGAWEGLTAGPRALAVGRLVHAKGFDVLLAAWTAIETPLVIAGDGPLRDTLQSDIERLTLGNRVRLIGQRDDIARLMREAAIFALPSRREGGPYTLVEALQQGLPAVCTKVGAVPDLVPARYICRPDDPRAFALAMSMALDDIEATKSAFADRFHHARTSLSCRAMTLATEDVYFATLQRLQRAQVVTER